PNSVTEIGFRAFQGCRSLTSVTIPNSVTSIRSSVFEGCSGLKNVTIPDSVTSIGEKAFYDCNGLTSVTPGNGVKEIGESAFSRCTSLKSITIPNSVTNIGDEAFSYCGSLKSFSVASGHPAYQSVGGLLLTKDGETLVSGVNVDAVIPDSVTSIGRYAFEGRSGLRRVTIPNSVTNIGYVAFYGCTGLTRVTIPDGVTRIENYAFGYCTSLTNAIIPDSVTSIGVDPFRDCTALKTLYVPGRWHGTAMLDGIVPKGCKVVYVVSVSFDAAGGTCTVRTKTCESGKPFGTLPTPKKTGYAFGGWWTGTNGRGTRMTSTSLVPGNVKTLHAKWTVTSYTVKFNANGGTGSMAAQTIAYDKTAKLRKNAFKRSGFVFAGWAKSKTGKVEYANQAGVKNLRSNGGTVTLYAKWARPAYTVAFDANGGAGNMAVQRMAYGKSAKLRKNAFTRRGWLFLGWATAKNGEVAYKDAASVKNLRTDGKTTTLHAVWEKGQLLRFDANGGTCAISEKTFRVGREYGSFPVPDWPRHTFLGWYTAADGGEWVSPADIAETAGTRTLFARWAYLPLRLGAESQSVGPLGAGRLSVAVSAKADWTAASDVEWILVHTQSINAGEGALVYDVAANEGNARTGRIVISANGKAFSFTVSQQARTLKLSASKKVFSKKAATGQKLGVTATVSWKAQSSASWLKVKTPSGNGDGTIVYELSENKGSGRAANITATGGGKSALFRVEQKGKDGSEAVPETPVESHYLQIEPGRQTYDMGEATNETALVMSDLSWTAATTNDWISLSTTNGSGYGVVAYQVAANAGNARTGTIAVAGGSLQATLTIEQKGTADEPPYLALLPEKRTSTAAAAHDETVWVEENVAWTVGVSAEWIDLKTTTGR
ncbi:MAG: leucine-rich repeat protein, partial [Kiritimatiellae bacterium]|nr:leucine-rich repeat protein [Kiritimatiellia bacterium]